MTPYVNGLKEKILSALGCAKDEKPFSGLKIVVDAGNGAGGFFAERLLEPLGADITGSRFLEPDGRFPNHQPNPENADAMRSICDAVTETGADFGIIFDTDVDRAGAVLPSDGGVIALDRNRLIALMTAILVRQYGPITVVTDSITSTGLTDFINSLGCCHHRFKRGYRNVINEAKRLLALEEAAKKRRKKMMPNSRMRYSLMPNLQMRYSRMRYSRMRYSLWRPAAMVHCAKTIFLMTVHT